MIGLPRCLLYGLSYIGGHLRGSSTMLDRQGQWSPLSGDGQIDFPVPLTSKFDVYGSFSFGICWSYLTPDCLSMLTYLLKNPKHPFNYQIYKGKQDHQDKINYFSVRLSKLIVFDKRNKIANQHSDTWTTLFVI
uniref:Uncharacterized protein n=1 Tax=Labrus bergylta TaxID=56723 RepID=A0A3Q3FSB5_9LABR